MARFTDKHVTFWLYDGSMRRCVELGPGPGDVTISNFAVENNREATDVYDHGALDGRVYGNEVVQEVSVTVDLRNQSLAHATEQRVLNALRWDGFFTDGTTADPGGQVKAHVGIIRLQDEVGNTDWIKLPNLRCTGELAVAAEGASISISGSNQGQPVTGDAAIPGVSA